MARPVVLPKSFVAWLWPYLEAFSGRTRATVAALAVGAVLAVGPRTVTTVLRTLGLADEPGFASFHRVLNRNAWSGLVLARTLVHPGRRLRPGRADHHWCRSHPGAPPRPLHRPGQPLL